MTKSDISYASIPTAAPADPTTSEPPYVQGFSLGSSHAVTIIVDEHNPQGARNDPYASEHPSVFLSGTRRPVHLSMCPKCHKANVRTSTRTYPSAVTWVGVVVSAAVCFPLCWVPLVVDAMKQTDHFCQSCGKKLGSIKALDGCFVKERM